MNEGAPTGPNPDILAMLNPGHAPASEAPAAAGSVPAQVDPSTNAAALAPTEQIPAAAPAAAETPAADQSSLPPQFFYREQGRGAVMPPPPPIPPIRPGAPAAEGSGGQFLGGYI